MKNRLRSRRALALPCAELNTKTMLTLNILPPIEKENYKTEITRRFAVFFGIGVFVVLVIFIAVLTVGYLFLYLQIEPLNKRLDTIQATEKARKAQGLERQIKDANKIIVAISNAKSQATAITGIIEKISASSSNDSSYLKTLLIDFTGGNAKISGYSKTRDQVVAIQDNLSKEASFENISAPYANFLKQKNIDFTFEFKIKK